MTSRPQSNQLPECADPSFYWMKHVFCTFESESTLNGFGVE